MSKTPTRRAKKHVVNNLYYKITKVINRAHDKDMNYNVIIHIDDTWADKAAASAQTFRAFCNAWKRAKRYARHHNIPIMLYPDTDKALEKMRFHEKKFQKLFDI